MNERIATTEARKEGFYWLVLGQNPPEIADWSAGNGGWLAMPSRGTPRR
jgi:hypothetical protein